MSLSPLAVRIEPERIDALDCWRIHTPHGVALVARQGAQLLRYDTADGRPLIWLSKDAVFEAGQALRGGVPVCWPWFGVYERNPPAVRETVGAPEDAPAHGLVRGRNWDLSAQRVFEDSAELVFTFDATRDLAPWRHPARLSLIMRFGEKITLAFAMQNLGEQPLSISLALHTYFAVGDSRQLRITGLEDTRYIDTVGAWEEKIQHGAIAIDGETDRIYQGVRRPVVIHDPAWGRAIHVVARQSNSAIVWNPWVEKSKRLSHFADDEWQGMVCVETARVMDDMLVVAPGATETVSLSVHAETE